jgi:hypothetical protein
MGDGGERLHDRMWGGEVDADVQPPVDAPVGAAVVGRHSFDLGVGPWGGTPWPGVPTFVITHRTRQDLLGDNGGNVRLRRAGGCCRARLPLFAGEQAQLVQESGSVTAAVTPMCATASSSRSYSQPRSNAMRTRSTRLRAPHLLIRLDV